MDENTNQTETETTNETDMPAATAEEATSVDAPDVDVSTDVTTMEPAADMGDANLLDDSTLESGLHTLNLLHTLSQDVIYLMGLSFILGSLFTVFVLLILDFIRRNNNTESK
jgi:hypothetical protein